MLENPQVLTLSKMTMLVSVGVIAYAIAIGGSVFPSTATPEYPLATMGAFWMFLGIGLFGVTAMSRILSGARDLEWSFRVSPLTTVGFVALIAAPAFPRAAVNTGLAASTTDGLVVAVVVACAVAGVALIFTDMWLKMWEDVRQDHRLWAVAPPAGAGGIAVGAMFVVLALTFAALAAELHPNFQPSEDTLSHLALGLATAVSAIFGVLILGIGISLAMQARQRERIARKREKEARKKMKPGPYSVDHVAAMGSGVVCLSVAAWSGSKLLATGTPLNFTDPATIGWGFAMVGMFAIGVGICARTFNKI